MAQRMKRRNTKSSASTNGVELVTNKEQHTAAEIRDYYYSHDDREKYMKKNFAEAQDVLKNLRDVTKRATKTVTAFNKSRLREYLKNIGSNERNLRNLSRYLYYRCHPYYRLIMYNANMFELNARSIIPEFSMTEENDNEKILSSYEETALILDTMNLQYEFLKAYVVCFREDVFYGCAYHDDTGFFIFPLDPDYCVISGIYAGGDFAFHMDMSYFTSRQTLLEFLGEPFVSMYRDFESTSERYQPMPEEYAVCLKARAEDWDIVLPVFSGLLNSIINLIDLEDIQAIADEQEIYKMIWMEMETLNSDMANDWKVSPDIILDYFNRMLNECLPEYISAAVVPGKLEYINFDNDKTTDTTKISKSTETLFNSAGGAQILNSRTISGTTAFLAAIKADTEMAISMLLPQTEAIVNRLVRCYASNPCKIKFYEISAYTKDDFRKQILESAQYGLPNKLLYNNLNGLSEIQTLALNNLEENILELSAKLVPLQSSYTTSGADLRGGRPESDPTELTDDGEASREKSDEAKG